MEISGQTALSSYSRTLQPRATPLCRQSVQSRQQGAVVKKIITIVDRLEGAEKMLREEGIILEAIYKAPELVG